MNSKNIIEIKSYKFALRIIKLYKYLTVKKKEFILSKQVLRSGTSVGANVKEALQAQSRSDFIYKLNISLKEASETEYWLDLLKDSETIDKKSYESIANDCIELIKLLTSIIKTSKSKLKTNNE
ncbi:MAG: four helix bundle protein [Bacteroidota bacterium]|nr:four helix bundle protein [Bacteroidota bacterium]